MLIRYRAVSPGLILLDKKKSQYQASNKDTKESKFSVQKWFGSAAICINEFGELLMVLQGKPEEEKTWSVPSGRQEENETFEECCVRELKEETGYIAEVVNELKVKKGFYNEINVSFEVHYFLVNIVGGE